MKETKTLQLMHGDILVADIECLNGKANQYKTIYNQKHLPPGTFNNNKILEQRKLALWQAGRAIPAARIGIENILKKIPSIDAFMLDHMAISLTDAYWLKTDKTDSLSWKDVNFHNNGFSEDFSTNILNDKQNAITQYTPDFATDGILEKAWIWSNEQPFLVKLPRVIRSTGKTGTQAANEVFAFRLAKLCNIEHVQYKSMHIMRDPQIACICPCFICDHTKEFVNFLQLSKEKEAFSKTEKLSIIHKLDFNRAFEQMLLFDALIGNTDRHERNFGIIRDIDTLEIIKPAPLFDSGNSLVAAISLNNMNNTQSIKDAIKRISYKPFNISLMQQINLCSEKIFIPDGANLANLLMEVYEEFKISETEYEISKEILRLNIKALNDANKIMF